MGAKINKLAHTLPTYMANVGEVEEDAQQNPHDRTDPARNRN